MEPLTPRQLEVLMLIRRHRREHAVSPTLEEMADVLGIAKVGVYEHVQSLRKKGAIRLVPHKARSIRLVGQHAERSPLAEVIADAVDALRKSRKVALADRLERNAATGLFAPMNEKGSPDVYAHIS